jgi:hypothetical protein
MTGSGRRPVRLKKPCSGPPEAAAPWDFEASWLRVPPPTSADEHGRVTLGRDDAARIVDVQWLTPHLASLGAVEISRQEYLTRLERALQLPLPAAFTRGHRS